jgi:hypothetical protein
MPSTSSLFNPHLQGPSQNKSERIFQNKFSNDEPMNLSSHDSSVSSDLAQADTQSLEQKTEVQQASVIVHASSAQASSSLPRPSSTSSSPFKPVVTSHVNKSVSDVSSQPSIEKSDVESKGQSSQSVRSDETPCSMDTMVSGSVLSTTEGSISHPSSSVPSG